MNGGALAWGRTQRLVLREFAVADVPDLVTMHHDPRLRAHLIDDYPLERPAVARLFVERLAPIYRRHAGLGIWRAGLDEAVPASAGPAGPDPAPVRSARTDPSFAGWFSLMPVAGMPGEVEIGGRLLPRFWGRGLALEGAECVLRHAFGDLGLTRVLGFCHPGNRAAATVLAALGFEATGVKPYDGQPALHHRIDLNGWRLARNTAPGTRLRHAARTRACNRRTAVVPAEPGATECARPRPPSGPDESLTRPC
jgi:RimJ/RimL family protein N-acetyltransferase